jgi:hypothetical protein
MSELKLSEQTGILFPPASVAVAVLFLPASVAAFEISKLYRSQKPYRSRKEECESFLKQDE